MAFKDVDDGDSESEDLTDSVNLEVIAILSEENRR
jgi:hypothetical protein